MCEFRLIAIRPLKECDSKYRKLLIEGEIYSFYQDYKFKRKNEGDIHSEIISIEQENTVPINLYNSDSPAIQVSAIVGKNGSGKSTILELLFITNYVLAIQNQILKPNPISIRKEIIKLKKENTKETLLDLEDFKNLKLESKRFEKLLNSLKVEVYYSIGKNIFCLRINKSIDLNLIKGETSTKRNFKINNILHEKKFDFDNFFYSIAINYSSYSLNSKFLGNWIESLFHKNDAYQTPIVINPYREEGNININTEIYLSKQRLLSNLLKPKKDENDLHRRITDYQSVEFLLFNINEKKVKYAYKRNVDGKIEEIGFDQLNYDVYDKKEDFIKKVITVFLGKDFETEKMKKVKYYSFIEDYIIKKLIQISRTYSKKYGFYFTDKIFIVPNFQPGSTISNYTALPLHRFVNIDEYLDLLYKDESHITFKLRQAINYLYTAPFESLNLETINLPEGEKQVMRVSIDSLSKHIFSFAKTQNHLIKFIPPSLFDIELEFHPIVVGKADYSYFSTLSSGEQQLIQSVQSILYHINNLDSVHNDKSDISKDKKKYEHLNIVLDEIELYFHPEFQRKFVNQLIKNILSLGTEKIKSYNILFATHSPFILSDIPSTNILQLKEGQIQKKKPQTFGANIHDLLHDSFFLNDGFMGEYAKEKINETITFLYLKKHMKFLEEEIKLEKDKEKESSLKNELENLNKEFDSLLCSKDLKYHLKLINIIGEPILRDKLLSTYYFIESNDEKRKKLKEEIKKMIRLSGIDDFKIDEI